MNTYNEKLRDIMNQIVELRSSDARKRSLEKQKAELENKVLELDIIMRREQADVEKLEKISLTSIIARIAGNKEEKLEKEQLEAYEAAARLETAKQELAYVKAQLAQVENDQWKLKDLEMEYAHVLEQKREVIKRDIPEVAQEILEREEAILANERIQKELQEAIAAGNKASSICNNILEQLDEASSWGTFDILGGGIVADAIKHSCLDDAQILVGKLQNQLHRFKTELADVKIQADMQVSIEGFARFADYFFDGIFADWSVLSKIDDSIEKVSKTKNEIQNVIRKLETMQSEAESKKRQLEAALNNIVRDYQ